MANKRGRIVGSVIRDNIIEILYFMEKSHAYELAKTYKKVFGPISIRSVYYNLKKGLELNVFEEQFWRHLSEKEKLLAFYTSLYDASSFEQETSLVDLYKVS